MGKRKIKQRTKTHRKTWKWLRKDTCILSLTGKREEMTEWKIKQKTREREKKKGLSSQKMQGKTWSRLGSDTHNLSLSFSSLPLSPFLSPSLSPTSQPYSLNFYQSCLNFFPSLLSSFFYPTLIHTLHYLLPCQIIVIK